MVQGMLKAIIKRPNYLSVSLYKLEKISPSSFNSIHNQRAFYQA